MPINQKRPDTPLATSPEARFTTQQDSIKPKLTWQKMSVAEKGNKKAQLIKEGGMSRFLQYKDSISTDATNRRDAEINKAAASKGMTKEEYAKWYKKNERKPDTQLDGLNSGDNGKEGKSKSGSAPKSPCKGGARTCSNR